MFKINKNNLLVPLITFFLGFILLLTLKGNIGNPKPFEIEDNLRTRGEPFELSPERGRYALTQSLAEDQSFFLRTDIARYVTPDLGYIDGKFIPLFSPGMSILASPLYVIGAKFQIAQIATFSLSVIFAILNFLLIVKISRKFNINLRSALIAGLAFLFATPAFAYSVSFYQHQTTTFLLLATTALLFSKQSLIKLTTAAFLVGFSFWIDSQNPIFFIPLIVFAIYRSFDIVKVKGQSTINFQISRLLAITGFILAIGAYSLYSYFIFHKPFQLSGTAKSISSFDSNNEPVLKESSTKKDPTKFFNTRFMVHGTATLTFNQDRGIIYYAPIMFLGLLGINSVFERKRKKAAVLLGTTLFIFTLYTMWGDPYGGWSFGPRYLIPAFAFMSIFLAAAVRCYLRKIWFKALFSLLFVYSASVNLLGALTTNQVPPRVEAVHLGLNWNYLLNWKMFTSGISSSFFYKTFASDFMSLYVYAGIISSLIILTGLTLIWFRKGEEN